MSKLIPSTDEWPRDQFLKARDKQMLAQAIADSISPPDANVIHIESGDEILCDNCNVEIEDPTVLLVEYGRRVNCKECFNRWYSNEPLTYKELREDGSLGRTVKPSDD